MWLQSDDSAIYMSQCKLCQPLMLNWEVRDVIFHHQVLFEDNAGAANIWSRQTPTVEAIVEANHQQRLFRQLPFSSPDEECIPTFVLVCSTLWSPLWAREGQGTWSGSCRLGSVGSIRFMWRRQLLYPHTKVRCRTFVLKSLLLVHGLLSITPRVLQEYSRHSFTPKVEDIDKV